MLVNVVSAVGSLAGFVRSEQVHPTSCSSARTREGSMARRIAQWCWPHGWHGRQQGHLREDCLLLQSRGPGDLMCRVFSSAC